MFPCSFAFSKSFQTGFHWFTYELLRNNRKSWCGEMILLGKDTHLETILNSVAGCLTHAIIKEGLGTLATRQIAPGKSLLPFFPKNPKKQAMNIFHPTDELIFVRWVAQPPTNIPRTFIEVKLYLPFIGFFPKSIESPGCRCWCHLWGAEFWFAGVVPGPDRSPARGPWKSTKMVVGSQWIMGLTMNYEGVHQHVLYTWPYSWGYEGGLTIVDRL